MNTEEREQHEKEVRQLGEDIIKIFGLEVNQETGYVGTMIGGKTSLGIGRIVIKMVLEGITVKP